MDYIFGTRKTPAEMLRQHKRSLDRGMSVYLHSVRDLDRERQKLENSEKKLINDIKATAKKGQTGACKVMAKDLVRTRRYIQKFYNMRTQLQAVGLRMQTLQSTQAMSDAMKGVTKAMRTMNKQVNLQAITKIMMEFEKESEMMDMKEEMMSDAIDDVMDEEEDETESDEIVNQASDKTNVLDEIGINLEQTMASAPNTKLSAGKEPAGKEPELADDAALQARLDNLRRE
ncbi:hypothetical protein SmJEL517_g01954 [Synchytrium microbalum]|uniref:Charged multivesicular body protein 2A n=1 Tax=Synchytrium microbalum TaxID=1806994 RepID=A0A507C8S4_9FUNG|nr:uncharacterized protein SmJEL517_g01954 [Synchytrium microbalum]TPX35738.1 hypothetical protein SmJEL517_g01954 [Synchytrium microbalum]